MRVPILAIALLCAGCHFTAADAGLRLSADQTPLYQVARGDPDAGRAAFVKLRCDSCHRAYSEKAGDRLVVHPLPDLSRESASSVASMILARTDASHGALFDDVVMAASARQMTPRELSNVVAYLRKQW